MIISKIKEVGTKILERGGRRVSRNPLGQYLNDFKIDCVLDVGANAGQFARHVRSTGYKARIESFEPLPAVFESLEASALSDPDWTAHGYALGSKNESRIFNISAHSLSSSFLPLNPKLDTGEIDLRTIREVKVEIKN